MKKSHISIVLETTCVTLPSSETIIAILLITAFAPVKANQMCSTETAEVPKYHLLEKCHRSKLGIAGKANYTSIISCQRLAIEKKGLALNFSPPEAKGTNEYTCEVLKCAEADGGQSLVNDIAFDYYSIYGRPIPDLNATCVPTIGMFLQLAKRMNYSTAEAECRNRSSVLADVTSEQRTDAVAQLLAGAGVEVAYAGLRRRNSSTFIGNNGDTLDCTTYRAWAPGHPRKNFTKFDCMLITRTKTWLSTSCKKEFPVLCELNPGGPYRNGEIFASRKRKGNGKLVSKQRVLGIQKGNTSLLVPSPRQVK